MMAITRLVLLTVLCDCNTLRRCLLVYLTHHHLRFTARTLIPHTKTYISNGGELFCALKPIDFFVFLPTAGGQPWFYHSSGVGWKCLPGMDSTVFTIPPWKWWPDFWQVFRKTGRPNLVLGDLIFVSKTNLLHTFSHYHNQTLKSTRFSCIF